MVIFSQHNTQEQRHQRSSNNRQRPSLYIIASPPSINGQPSSCEWTFEVSIPNASTKTEKHGFALLHHRQKATAQADTDPKHVVESAKHYYFSRLTHGNYTTNRPATILRIFLTSFPMIAKTQDDHDQFLKNFVECFEQAYMTPESAGWLRQALFSLQISEMIPPASHGLDINNFMSFATSCLEGHVRDGSVEQNAPKEVNYAKLLRHNQHLKRTAGAEGTSFAVLNPDQHLLEESDEDEDVWNPSTRGQEKRQKNWGGFWITYGSAADRSRDSSRERDPRQNMRAPRQRSDVYGGLM